MPDSYFSLVSPSGEVFHQVSRPLDPGQATELVRQGALVMIDPCGDGCVGVDWLNDEERAAVAARGMMLSRNGYGELQRWESSAGKVAVFVDGGDLWH